MRSPRIRSIVLIVVALLLPFTAAACGADDDSSDAASDDAGSSTTDDSADGESAEVDMEAACDTWVDADAAVIGFFMTGEGDPDAVNETLDAALESADPQVTDTLSELIESAQADLANPDGGEGEGEGDEEDPTFDLYTEMIGWAGENCDVQQLEITAIDYGYQGIPVELEKGYTVVEFHNEGEENHEILLLKKNPGVTESAQELLAMPEEEAMSKVTIVNAGFAPSGGSSTVSWSLTESGDYIAVCFLPVGSVGETQGDGPPHFTEGMVQEFTVS